MGRVDLDLAVGAAQGLRCLRVGPSPPGADRGPGVGLEHSACSWGTASQHFAALPAKNAVLTHLTLRSSPLCFPVFSYADHLAQRSAELRCCPVKERPREQAGAMPVMQRWIFLELGICCLRVCVDPTRSPSTESRFEANLRGGRPQSCSVDLPSTVTAGL